MRIERNSTAWIKETAKEKYLLVSSIAYDPTYFLTEIFIATDLGWTPLVCAPIDDPKIRAVEAHFENSVGEFTEIILPEGLSEPLGRAQGESWVQFSSQDVAAWSPGAHWWQRLQHKLMGQTRVVDELRNAEGAHQLG